MIGPNATLEPATTMRGCHFRSDTVPVKRAAVCAVPLAPYPPSISNRPALSSIIGSLVLPEPHEPDQIVFTLVAVRRPALLPQEPINNTPPGAVVD